MTTRGQMEPGTERAPGAWVAYNSDGSAAVLFFTEIDALRYALPYAMNVHYVPYGHDAITGEKA